MPLFDRQCEPIDSESADVEKLDDKVAVLVEEPDGVMEGADGHLRVP